ncbi:MAG: tRNA 2-thiouridine(34) synthase MnmA [Mycoplasmataceae bacterium]|nr:tRNA 2-thiouridine(34) synthase MnmA [Mycoplasmataceae bacterium]
MAKIVIGLSGGVDSAVAAYLLKKQGHEVIGIFMRNWDSVANNDTMGNKNINDFICPQEVDYNDAVEVAKIIGIPIHRVDFVEEYWKLVFEDFIDEYKKGRTPNPDILCNKYIKFDKLLNYSIDKLKVDFLATGHYAIVKEGTLYRGKDKDKDQSYFLSQLSNKQLSKVIFPLGEMKKVDVRKIALEAKLNVALKKDSTGICFIGERNFSEFLENYIPAMPGNIVDFDSGKIIGNHKGVMYYTIGQSKGLKLGGMPEKYFVVSKDIKNRLINVAPFSKERYLVSNRLIATNLNIISDKFSSSNITAKFRYRQDDSQVVVKVDRILNEVIVDYSDGQTAITPGQQIVFYSGDQCLGGAIINKIYYDNQELKIIF